MLFENRAKLYRFIDQEWKERGTGVIKILHHEGSGRVRLLMRRDQVRPFINNTFLGYLYVMLFKTLFRIYLYVIIIIFTNGIRCMLGCIT